jgi:hypothetical protein
MFYKYILKSKEARDKADLRKCKNDLERVVKNKYGNDLIFVTVLKEGYEYELKRKASRGELIALGKAIAKEIDYVKRYIVTYFYTPGPDNDYPGTGKSNQIFIRLENKNICQRKI